MFLLAVNASFSSKRKRNFPQNFQTVRTQNWFLLEELCKFHRKIRSGLTSFEHFSRIEFMMQCGKRRILDDESNRWLQLQYMCER